MPDKYRISLIHGTWARNAKWTKEDSVFCFFLKTALGGDVEFDRPDWDGRNRLTDRKTGGKELADHLLRTGSPAGGRKHFVVCHSHGGNVALYATGEERLQSGFLTGIICLNTPFFCAVPRNIVPLWTLLFFVTLSLLLVAVGFIGSVFEIAPLRDNVLAVLLFGVVSWTALLLLLTKGPNKWINWGDNIQRKRDEIVNELNLPTTRIPVLSIWTAGDEVSSSFSILGGLAGLPFLLLTLPGLGLFLVVIILAFVKNWIPLLHSASIVALDAQGGWELKVLDFSYTYIMDPILNVSSYFIAAIFIATIIAVVVNALFVSLPFGLGLRKCAHLFLVRVFATPVPATAQNTDFEAIDVSTMSLSHSAIYESHEVIGKLAEWIRRCSAAHLCDDSPDL